MGWNLLLFGGECLFPGLNRKIKNKLKQQRLSLNCKLVEGSVKWK